MTSGVPALDLAIVGNAGGTNIGESLRAAALASGHRVQFFNAYEANAGNRFVRAFYWRVLGRRPVRLKRFAAAVVERCAAARPQVLLATGAAPLDARALLALRRLGTVCVNYSTDDPWNPGSRAEWHLRALPHYDAVFTPRRANMDDLRRLGCKDVRYLPFGYDERLFSPSPAGNDRAADEQGGHGVLLVGGADAERVSFMKALADQGLPISLVGDYWHRYAATRAYALGHKAPDEVRRLTATAKVNLCLVRRANRDGHVMRTFEMAAIGACMLVEDTDEHRAIFGPDGECVRYFADAGEAAARARALLGDPVERSRLASAVQRLIGSGGHTYGDRLQAMLRAAVAPARVHDVAQQAAVT